MATSPTRPFDPDDVRSLPVVQMVSAGEAINSGQVHRAWTAMVSVAGSTEPALPVALKWMPSSVKVAIELGCSLAATALKLPVPRGMLVLAHPADLKGLPTSAAGERSQIVCFGSVLRWPEQARVRNGDAAIDEFTWQRFCETATAAPGAAWDELVANDDRHPGNLIFDGTRYWLIDHDHALRPVAEAARQLSDPEFRRELLDHRAKANQAAGQLTRRRPNDHNLLEQPSAFAAKSRALDALVHSMSTWRTGRTEIDAILQVAEIVVRGIMLRLPALGLQLTDRISKPGSPLQWTSNIKTSSNR